jgi:chloramphenicol 3-O phosphotransferase
VDSSHHGRILLINGASSSGKSSIALALLPLMPDPWFYFPVDALGAMRSTAQTSRLMDGQAADILRRTRLGYHRAVAGLASAGNDVVMDYPLSEAWRLTDLLKVLDGFDVTLVEVWCDPNELSRRELARGDRPRGLARSQEQQVYAVGDSDIRVDSTASSAQACAEQIRAQLPRLHRRKAFDRLRAGDDAAR